MHLDYCNKKSKSQFNINVSYNNTYSVNLKCIKKKKSIILQLIVWSNSEVLALLISKNLKDFLISLKNSYFLSGLFENKMY